MHGKWFADFYLSLCKDFKKITKNPQNKTIYKYIREQVWKCKLELRAVVSFEGVILK